jgi:hypothetical protein
LAAAAARRALEVASAIRNNVDPAFGAAEQHRIVRVPMDALRSHMADWNEAGSRAAVRSRDQIQSVLQRIVPQIVRAFLDLIDLNEIVDRVDVDRAADRVTLERIMARIDLDDVASRIDVDAVAARIDLDRVVGRMDLAGIAKRVIDELELGEIIREATGTVTVEAVDALRVGGMSADQFVSRMVDRVLGRKGQRSLELSSPSGNGGGPDATAHDD